MATSSVPGADPKNFDELHPGCWAEGDDGASLIYVLGYENGQVVFQLYDTSDGLYYQDAMIEDEFKAMFSFPPVGTSKDKWTWHDKTPFPFDRVMKRFRRPAPQHADVEAEEESVARKIARRLKIRGRRIDKSSITAQTNEEAKRAGYEIMDRIATALGRLVQ